MSPLLPLALRKWFHVKVLFVKTQQQNARYSNLALWTSFIVLVEFSPVIVRVSEGFTSLLVLIHTGPLFHYSDFTFSQCMFVPLFFTRRDKIVLFARRLPLGACCVLGRTAAFTKRQQNKDLGY